MSTPASKSGRLAASSRWAAWMALGSDHPGRHRVAVETKIFASTALARSVSANDRNSCLVSDGIGLQREVGFALVPENVGHPIMRDEVLDEGDHRCIERPAFRPLRDRRAADGDGSEDHAVEGASVDELVRHQRPRLPRKTVRAQKRRSRHVTAAADEIENTVGMAGLMPLRGAVRGVGLSGDEDDGRPWRLLRAVDLDLAVVFHEAPGGVERERRRLRARTQMASAVPRGAEANSAPARSARRRPTRRLSRPRGKGSTAITANPPNDRGSAA